MFFCKNCGTKIENEGAKFCPKCGQKFEPRQGQNSFKKAGVSPVQDIKDTDVADNNTIGANNAVSSADIKVPPLPELKSTKTKGKKGKGLFIALIVLIVLMIVSAGTLIYLYKTGKLKKFKKEIYKVLHIKKSETKSERKKHKKSSKSTNKKNKNGSNSAKQPKAKTFSSARNYVYNNSRPSYYNSNRSNQGNGFASFKNSLSSASSYITGISPLSNSDVGNAPAVIISNVIAEGTKASPGTSVTLFSKFYTDTPSNLSSQSVKLTYEVYGNGLTAYNNSYVNVTKPGIYSVALRINIPSNFPAGTYSYVLTVTSTATIEESPAAYIKVR